MQSLKIALLAAVGSMALVGAAQAADRPLGLTWNVGGSTDYEFRGISQSNHNPQIFAGADVTIAKIFYAGTWLSNVDFADPVISGVRSSSDVEYDLYAGVKPTLGPVAFDFGAIRYGYTHGKSNHFDYWEFKAAGSMPVGPATVGAAFFFSPNTFGPGNVNSYYYELNASAPIPNTKLTVSGAIGKQDFQGPNDYNTWNLGIGYAVNDTLGLDLRYWDTDTSESSYGGFYANTGAARVVLGLKATF
jgi:uncharacterized protein (TIGR02001 family)